jgi:hypothetical protein
MSDMPVNPYEAVIADLEARKAQIEATITNLKAIAAQAGLPSGPSGGGGLGPGAFLGMSIPEATKKYLSNARGKKSTQEVIDALTEGGLPKSKYSTVYSILRRRESQVGDIVNMDGDWGLKEWYPNYKRKASSDDLLEQAEEDEKLEEEMGPAKSKTA